MKLRIVTYSRNQPEDRQGREQDRSAARQSQVPGQSRGALANEEEDPPPKSWESTIEIGAPEPRHALHIRLDKDVLSWFKAHGTGCLARINPCCVLLSPLADVANLNHSLPCSGRSKE